MDISIIIVNYNTKELTRNCLRSVFEQTKDIDFEVIVSDNGSSDGSIDMIRSEFPQVILIENGENLGFGAANNRALKVAKGKYVFYLNSDTVLLNNAVKIFFDYWENSPEKENIGALGCWLQDEHGNSIHSGGEFPTYKSIYRYFYRCCVSSICGGFLKWFKRKKRKFIPKNKVENFKGYITGADLFLRNNDFAYFDEDYFMYFEETDCQLNNLKKREKKILILSDPKIIHLEGGSDTLIKTKYSFKKKSSIFYWTSCLLYFRKNYGHSFYLVCLKKLVFFVWFCCHIKTDSIKKVI